jgi:hypothetical protein
VTGTLGYLTPAEGEKLFCPTQGVSLIIAVTPA